MMGKEAFLLMLLRRFATETPMDNLEKAIEENAASEIFDQAYTLKGVAENLGLKPLYDEISVLVEITRHGGLEGAEEAFAEVKQAYGEIMKLLEPVLTEQ